LEEISAAPDGLRTGFAELDDTVRLSQNGVTIVAARPSHGKTSFKMNLLLNLLELYPDKTFYFFSYEEPVKIITLKLLNILAGIRFEGQQLPNLVQYLRHQYTAAKHFQHETNTNDTSETKNGIFTIEHTSAKQSASIEAVETAKQKLGQYFDTGRLLLFGNRPHPEHIRAMIEQRQIERSVGGVFVDYVQKVKPASGKFATRQLELQNVSSQLHGIAVDLNVPMIVGAQFNREVRTESDVREDCLREAGDLEQDANLVLALWNPAKTEQDETSIQAQLGSKDVRRVELKVKTLKNRDGAVNLKGVPLLYDMPLSTIKSMR
jgi:replicative DNA helicase